MSELPTLIVTEHYSGYDYDALLATMDEATRQRFTAWFMGQTGAIHDGRSLVYKWDYERFMQGRRPLD